MTSSERALAGRYAKALLLAAQSQGGEAKLRDELSAARAVCDEFAPFLRHPRVGPYEKMAKLRETLSGRASKLTMNFLGLLIEKKRLEILPAIEDAFGALVLEKNNRALAEVSSARALSDAERAKIEERLSRFSGKTVEASVRQDPALLGGVVVRLGDWVIDSSLKGRLQGLLSRMTAESSQGGSSHVH